MPQNVREAARREHVDWSETVVPGPQTKVSPLKGSGAAPNRGRGSAASTSAAAKIPREKPVHAPGPASRKRQLEEEIEAEQILQSRLAKKLKLRKVRSGPSVAPVCVTSEPGAVRAVLWRPSARVGPLRFVRCSSWRRDGCLLSCLPCAGKPRGRPCVAYSDAPCLWTWRAGGGVQLTPERSSHP
jgi:hypothetical protein